MSILIPAIIILIILSLILGAILAALFMFRKRDNLEKRKVTLWIEPECVVWVREHFAENIGHEIQAEITVTSEIPSCTTS